MNMMVLSKSERIQEFLKRKLMQYLSRMYDVKEREDIRRDAFYKAGLVQALFNDESVSQPLMHFILNRLSNGKIDDQAYAEAWKVIEDYNHTGGESVVQRTDQKVRA